MLFSSVGGSESFVNMSPDDSAYDWWYLFSDRGDHTLYAKTIVPKKNGSGLTMSNASPKGIVEINPYDNMEKFLKGP
jgi:hypothetical protein